MKLVKEKSFYFNILAITVPLALHNLINFSTNMFDTIMLGRADDTGVLLSAASLAGQPFFLLLIFIFGISGAGGVLSAQYWGKKNIEAIKIVFATVIRIAFFSTVVFTAVILLFPENVMGILTNRPEVIKPGSEYLKIIAWAYPLFAISSSFVCSLRSVEIVRVFAIFSIFTLFISVGLNYVLIFGNLGFPALGIRGAAIATLTARIFEFIFVMSYVFLIDKRLKFRPKNFLLKNKQLLCDLLRHGSPVVGAELAWALGMVVQAAIFGHITYSHGDPVAANSITGVVQHFSSVFMFGIANAAAVLIGKAVGEGNTDDVKAKSDTFKVIALIAGLTASAMILLVRNPVVSFYNLDEATARLARDMLIVSAVCVNFISFAATYIVGILRGAGDTAFCLKVEIAALWLFSLPIAAFLAFILQLPVPFVLLGMRSDEAVKTIVCTIRTRGKKWIKLVARDELE